MFFDNYLEYTPHHKSWIKMYSFDAFSIRNEIGCVQTGQNKFRSTIRLNPHADTGVLTPSADWIMRCFSDFFFLLFIPIIRFSPINTQCQSAGVCMRIQPKCNNGCVRQKKQPRLRHDIKTRVCLSRGIPLRTYRK